MDNTELVCILKEVPETRLRLIDLAREAVKEDGSLDYELLAFQQKEVKEAVAEAEEYMQATGEAIRCLRTLALS